MLDAENPAENTADSADQAGAIEAPLTPPDEGGSTRTPAKKAPAKRKTTTKSTATPAAAKKTAAKKNAGKKR